MRTHTPGGTGTRAAQQQVEKARRLEENGREGHLTEAEELYAELDGEMASFTEFLRALELQLPKKARRDQGGAGLGTRRRQ